MTNEREIQEWINERMEFIKPQYNIQQGLIFKYIDISGSIQTSPENYKLQYTYKHIH